MDKNVQIIVKALTPGELADMYEVSPKTMRTWINSHKDRVGTRVSKYFTALQVKIIYDCLGVPQSLYREE